jgi:hypothetical protein
MTTQPETETETAELPLFSTFIAEVFKEGTVDAEITAALQELNTAVIAVRKKGTLTIQLTVEPSNLTGDDRLTTVVEKVKTVLPEETRPKALLYVSPTGVFTKDPPNQTNLFNQPDEGTP